MQNALDKRGSTIEEELERLLIVYKKFKICVGIMLGILALAIVFVFNNKKAAFVMILVGLLFHLFVLRSFQTEYTRGVVDANLKNTLCRELGTSQIKYDSGGDITPGVIEKAALIPVDERRGACYLKKGIIGELEKRRVSLCDGVFQESFQLVENGKNRIHILPGTWVKVTLNGDTKGDFRILDRDVLPVPVRQKFYEDKGFVKKEGFTEKGLIVYTCTGCEPLSNGEGALSAGDGPLGDGDRPSEGVIEKFLELSKYTPGKAAASLKDGVLNVFIRDRMLARGVSVRQPVSIKLLGLHPLPELKLILELAKACENG